MTVKFANGIEVNRPTTTPVKSSVLDHVKAAGNLVENGEFGLTNNAGLWPSYNCLDLLVPTTLCPDPLTKTTKTFAFAAWQPSFEFALYGGVQCSNVGLDKNDMKSEATRVFEEAIGFGIEQALLGNRFVVNAGTTDPRVPTQTISWPAPTVLTNGAAPGLLSAYAALALLEGNAAATYRGVPTIHMPRALATLLEVSGLIVWKGDLAYTVNGSKVAMGGGYDDPTAEATGSWDVYATGEVYVEQAEEISVQQNTLPGYVAAHATGSTPSDLTDNSTIVLVERMFRAAVDCMVLKTTAKVW